METNAKASRQSPPRGSVAFLLAQLGAHASTLFTDRVAELDLTPAQAGLLRTLAADPGRSQREIAARLGMPPTRFVPFADALEERGLLERRKNPNDRRQHALYLTEAGTLLVDRLRTTARQHDEQICAGLTDSQRHQLLELLTTIAAEQELTPGVHPGYQRVTR